MIPLTKSQLKTLRDKKIAKYKWVPEVLSHLLMKKLPTSTQVNIDDLISNGLIELTKQMDRLYSNETMIKRLYNPKKKDLTVGPFFLKGLKSPYPSKTDPGSVKYIKIAILDALHAADPAPRPVRKHLSAINKYKDDYFKKVGMYPSRRQIREKLNLTHDQYDEAMYYDGL